MRSRVAEDVPSTRAEAALNCLDFRSISVQSKIIMRLDVAALLAAFSNPAYVAAREVLHFLGKKQGRASR